MQSRFFTAYTAAARLKAAPVELMGRQLRPLSLMHTIVLDELLGDDWHDESLDLSTLDIISAVCSERTPLGYVPSYGLEADELTRYTHALLRFDEAAQCALWREFYDVCYGSQPRIKPPTGAGRDWRAPYQSVMLTFLARHIAISDDTVLHDWVYAQVRWTFETLFEQLQGSSRILSDIEPPEPTPEETAHRHRFEDLSLKIVAACMKERAALGPASDKNAAARHAIAAKQAGLIALAQAGRLADDLTEISA